MEKFPINLLQVDLWTIPKKAIKAWFCHVAL